MDVFYEELWRTPRLTTRYQPQNSSTKTNRDHTLIELCHSIYNSTRSVTLTPLVLLLPTEDPQKSNPRLVLKDFIYHRLNSRTLYSFSIGLLTLLQLGLSFDVPVSYRRVIPTTTKLRLSLCLVIPCPSTLPPVLYLVPLGIHCLRKKG